MWGNKNITAIIILMVREIIFVTGNETKLKHANEAVDGLGYKFVAQKLDIIEAREEEPEKVVIEKALQAIKILNRTLVVEDSGIFIEALNGFPKTFVHFVESTVGVEGVIKMMKGVKNRKVEFRQSLAYIEPGMDKPIVFSYIDGGYTIAKKVCSPKFPCSDFDKILIPPGESKTLGMFSIEWRAKRDTEANKNTIHYRQLAKYLTSK